MLFAASAALAETIDVPGKHFSIDLPAGWTDSTEAGSEYDLELTGPSGIVCMIDSETWVAGDSYEDLNEMMQETITELQAEGYSVSITVATQNITVNGVSGIDTTISLFVSSTTVKERLVIFASEDWNMGWFLIFAGVEPGFSQADSGMDAVVNSFTVAEKEGDGGILSRTTVILLVIGVVVVVVIIVVVLLLMKKKPSPAAPMPMPSPPEAQQPPVRPPPPGQ